MLSQQVMKSRIDNLRKEMERLRADGLLAIKLENRRYLSGFGGSSGAVLVTRDVTLLITDFRYIEQACQESPHCEVVKQEGTLDAAICSAVQRLSIQRLAIEEDTVTVEQWNKLRETGAQLVSAAGAVEKLRLVKSAEEIQIIERAMRATEQALAEALQNFKIGMTEAEAAIELECGIRRHGADRIKPNFVVASGPRSALPHGRPTSRVIQPGDFLVMDIGGFVEGYYSDVTRTVVFGDPSPRQREVYNLVLSGQMLALEAIGPGVPGEQVDAMVRKLFAEKGFRDEFGHSLGHGVGLALHEGPRLARGFGQPLRSGMVVTVEPGLYISGWGGIRIEDMVVITENGVRNLTTAPKELQSVGL